MHPCGRSVALHLQPASADSCCCCCCGGGCCGCCGSSCHHENDVCSDDALTLDCCIRRLSLVLQHAKMRALLARQPRQTCSHLSRRIASTPVHDKRLPLSTGRPRCCCCCCCCCCVHCHCGHCPIHRACPASGYPHKIKLRSCIGGLARRLVCVGTGWGGARLLHDIDPKAYDLTVVSMRNVGRRWGSSLSLPTTQAALLAASTYTHPALCVQQ